jgi:lysophospholipase L1-like esterase
MIKNIKWLALAAIALTACNNDDEVVANNSSDGLPLTSGSANFSKYVALGNSLTAGYTDGALFIEGQKNSWTKILSDQFKLVGGGEYKIPFMPDNKGGALLGTIPVLENRLYFNGAAPVRVPGAPTAQLLPGLTGQFNNMGVPGAKSFHLLAPGYGNPAGILAGTANPYFCRFASSPTASVIGDAMAQQPTFFTLWIGNNDVLGYATSGGDGTNPITPSAGPAGVGFDATYNALVTTLTSAGAKGALGNIPNVATLPFFKTVPTSPLSPTALGGAVQINTINTNLYGPLKAILSATGDGARINLLSATAANPLLIVDETLTDRSANIAAAFTPTLGAPTAAAFGAIFGRARQTTTADLVLLTTSSVVGTVAPGVPAQINVFGVTYPLQDKHILIPTEITEIANATSAFNATIAATAASKDLAFVNANAVLTQVATTGLNVNGFNFTGQLVFGHAFSLDGVHPTARGYALIANEFAKSINAKYGSNLSAVNVGVYNNLWPLILP